MTVAAPLRQPLYPRGSEWRRWDLQVHTPHSALNNGFGSDFDTYAKRLLETAVSLEIAAVGMTDYFSIDGYTLMRQLLADQDRLERLVGPDVASRASKILFLPNVELRASVVVRAPDGSDSRVNFHVLFSDLLSPNDIEENFLRELRLTAESAPDTPDNEWSLTRGNLEALGRRLKAEHAGFAGRSDLVVGMTNAVVNHELVTKVLSRQASRFEDRFLLIVPADEDLSDVSWDGQGHLTRKLLIQKAHMLFSSNPGTREFGLGRRHATVRAFRDEFKTLKPCVHGSDAHTYERLFRPAEDRHTWVKADPTFRGLQQLLHEPEARVFIGVVPPSLVQERSRPTRIVDRALVEKVPGSTLSESWFQLDMPLNPGLVVVIGNKGSGKSALADILALVGNTKRVDAFSFLNEDRFRSPRDGRARDFQASLIWADSSTDGPIRLDRDPNPTSVERVRYIPQNYLEEICNEIGSGKRSRFYEELQKVIFSHVPSADRLGFSTLDELLAHLGDGINKTIGLLQSELAEINKELASLLERSWPDEARTLTERLAEKRREIEAHDRSRPNEVPLPSEDEATQAANREVAIELAQRQSELQAASEVLEGLRAESAVLTRRRATANRLLTKLANLRRQFDAAIADAQEDFAELGLDPSAVVQFDITDAPIHAVIAVADQRLAAIAEDLDSSGVDNPASRRMALLGQVSDLEERLTAPQQEYQRYRKTLAAWEARRAEIQGSAEISGSIAYLEGQLEGLRSLPGRIRTLVRRRDGKALEIYAQKQLLREHYERYHRPVQDFLGHQPLADEDFHLTFQTSIREAEFRDRFLAMVHQRKVGPFSGVEEGSQFLESMLRAVNWNSALGVLRFARAVLSKMTAHADRQLNLRDQLVQSVSVDSLLNYLFSFDYLDPIYELKWDGKGVDELSPGERGNLLLIFYFLIDREDIPLVIDQPEENLDNQTVVRTLVPCVRDAKGRRQIVIVTHNPNLAVVCDADQVVYSEMTKAAGNRITYESGSIEDPTTNRRILDVLEGTRPAFDQRDARYIE